MFFYTVLLSLFHHHKADDNLDRDNCSLIIQYIFSLKAFIAHYSSTLYKILCPNHILYSILLYFLFLAVLVLHCRMWLFSVLAAGGYSLAAMH